MISPTDASRSPPISATSREWCPSGCVVGEHWQGVGAGTERFFRRFTGSFLDRGAGLTVQETYVGPKQAIRLILTNGGADEVQLVITNAYAVDSVTASLAAGQTVLRDVSLAARHGWYDILVTMPAAPRFGVQLAGHVETDADSFTDPMMS